MRQTYEWGLRSQISSTMNQKDYPTFFQYAWDTLAIPTTTTECERAFNSTKKLVTRERNCLADDVIEACECLKA